VVDEVTVVEHGPVPLQPPPDHPVNVEPLLALAVSATTVPLLNASLQSAPQLIPDGDEVTVPAPEPDFATVSVC
jgi:hypothetical protein